MSENEKCPWCGTNERHRIFDLNWDCGTRAIATVDARWWQGSECRRRELKAKVARLEAEVARLQAAMSAAMQIIRRPGLLLWADLNKPAPGYWVKITEDDWQHAGPELMDAIELLAGAEKKETT